jgi:tetratricopeptide (TPR) repeat protein
MLQVDEAQACLAQAQKYWQSQQWQETIQTCAQALALDQQLPQAHKLMGDALQKTGKAKEAIGYYQEAIKLNPDFIEVYANLGTLYVQQKQYPLGINYYQQALKIDPNFTGVKKHLARAKLLLQSHSVSMVPADANTALDHHLEQGRSLQRQGAIEEALKQYLTAAKVKPQRVETYREIVKLCENLELWSEAAKYCRRILQLTNGIGNLDNLGSDLSLPSAPSQTVKLSEPQHHSIVPSSLKNTATAEAIANQRQSLFEKVSQSQISLQEVALNAPQYLAQGKNFADQGNYKSALDCYRRVIQQQPELIDAYLVLGRLLNQLSQLDQAIKCYLAGLKQQQHPELYFALGNVYHRQQQWAKAALCYQKTSQIDPSHSQACHELGEVLSQQQRWSEAVTAYRQAIALKTDYSWSYNNLGYALIQLQRWSEAIPTYLQAIKLKPDFSWSYYNLAEAYGKLEQWSEAIASYQQAVKLQADLPQIQQKLGNAFYRRSQQDRASALTHFRLAIAQDPQNPEPYHQALAIDKGNLALYLKLGDVLAESGSSDQALVTYQMALQIQPKNIEVLSKIQHYQDGFSGSYALPINDYGAFTKELQGTLPHSDTPKVSIIIPVYNQLDYTLRCLKAIALNYDQAIPVEIILVNDCSTDQTAALLSPLTAINLINQPLNQGFIAACNQGAAIAKGKYLYFLNNDTEIKPNCIASLVKVLAADQTVGAVGSKLIYPQGILQEAGGIVWQDASGWNYGRQANSLAPEYNYLRPVDYCSGASLMVKKAVFDSLEGFATEFAPAYYEDTDLCFAIRHQLGMKVMYQPKSEVIHHEGISSGTSITSGTKKYQAVNALKFREKWQDNLNQDHYLANVGLDHVPLAATRHLGQETILVIDSYMPSYDRESGSRRLFELLKIFKALNYHVIFVADNGVKEEPYVSVLQNLQIEVLYTQSGYGKTIEEQIESRLKLINLAWTCRPELNQKYASLIRRQPEIKLIYDTVDLHYLRLKRAWGIDPSQYPKEEWVEMQAKELNMAQQADLTITVTTMEQKILEAQGIEQVAVIPNIHRTYQDEIPHFAQREGILFIGSYNHAPNVDGVLWLCQEVMPFVWQINPDIKVTLLGHNPSPEVLALGSDRITVTGYIDDVSPYFLSHKLSVSPLRYGAGMKGKIGQSLEYSLPVVSTHIGMEGMNLVAEEHILAANNALDFAQQIIRLYTDADLWQKLSSNASKAIANYSPAAVQLKVAEIVQQIKTIEDNPKKSD